MKKTRQRKEKKRRNKQASEREKARRAQQSIKDKEKDWITMEEDNELETSEAYEEQAKRALEDDAPEVAGVYATLALTATLREVGSIVVDLIEEALGYVEEDDGDGEADSEGDAE